MPQKEKPVEWDDDLDLIIQALSNVGNTFGGRSKILLQSLSKEVRRLKHVRVEQERRESIRRYRENERAKKVGGELPYPNDDIPF